MRQKNPTRRSFLQNVAVAGAALVSSENLQAATTARTAQRIESLSYPEILRAPDLLVAYSGLNSRMALARSNDDWGYRDISVQTSVVQGPNAPELSICLHAPQTALTNLHLRWHHKVASELRILGDAWERSYGDLEWRGFVPERPLPWYFLTFDGHQVNGYGVRTGARTLCFWQIDPGGVSLWLDLRNGGNPVRLGERQLQAANVVTRRGQPGETPIEAARLFCRCMCPRPCLPDGPLYGSNDWNYAYGRNTAEGILRDADLIASLAPSQDHRPFVVIDDGWQDKRRFPDMAGLASAIRDRKLRPGIWVRPTQAPEQTKASLLLPSARFAERLAHPVLTYDPTIPEALEAILDSVRRALSWGFEFLKHDYSTYELLGRWGSEMGPSPTREGWNFADCSLTNAEILISFYQALRRIIGNKAVILGCNTVGHLSAGIFESQRTGDDTSGTSWERTRRMGVNTLAFRNPQHRTFFYLDPDCVALTPDLSWNDTRQWLDLVSRSGVSLFISPQPETIGSEQRTAIKDAFQIVASSTGFAEDWLDHTTPQHWLFETSEGSRQRYEWSRNEGAFPFQR